MPWLAGKGAGEQLLSPPCQCSCPWQHIGCGGAQTSVAQDVPEKVPVPGYRGRAGLHWRGRFVGATGLLQLQAPQVQSPCGTSDANHSRQQQLEWIWELKALARPL